MARGVTKSDLLRLERCEKAFWLRRHQAERGEPVSSLDRRRREQGVQVGEKARELFPGGLLIGGAAEDPAAAVAATERAIADGALVLYEAAFHASRVVTRPDVIVRDRVGGAWRIYECKAANATDTGDLRERSVSEAYELELAIQRRVMEEAGQPVESTSLILLRKEHRQGADDRLFVISDRSRSVRQRVSQAADLLLRALVADAQGTAPERDIGRHCTRGGDCEFRRSCQREKVPEGPTIFDLPHFKNRWTLYERGEVALEGLNEVRLDLHLRPIRQAILAGRRMIDRRRLRQELRDYDLPLVHLDFETIDWAIPRFPGTRPWQSIPFQFSCDVETGRGDEVLHWEYLHEGESDPRPALIEALAEPLARFKRNPIVAWFASFEEQRLRELAEFPSPHSRLLRNAAKELIDPIDLVKATYYDPAFKGSYSLKSVAPALLGAAGRYSDLEVGDGGEAVVAWERMQAAPDDATRRRLREALLVYCRQDTRVMVDILRFLKREDAAPAD